MDTVKGTTHKIQQLFVDRGWSLSVAESCTGGMVSNHLTNLPGSSAYYLGGIVAYSNEIKQNILGLPKSLIAAHGAVSLPVVRAMAKGMRRQFASTWALSTSGVAGPSGGSLEKPVGTVCFAISGPSFEWCNQQVFSEARERTEVMSVASCYAIEALWKSVNDKQND